MPLYDFRCEDCGDFEQWLQMSETKNPMACPTCHQEAKRVFSPPSIMLSGQLRTSKSERSQPELVTRSLDRPPAPRKAKEHNHGRPWMISH
jgi:putative FmdB family regulatory protein